MDGSIKAVIGADISQYMKAMQSVASTAQATMGKVQKSTGSGFSSMANKLSSVMSSISSSASSKFSSMGKFMVAPFSKAGGAIQRVISGIGEKIPQPFKSAFSAVGNITTKSVNAIGRGFSGVGRVAGGAGSVIKTKLSSAFSSVDGGAGRFFSKFQNNGNQFTSQTRKMGSSIFGIAKGIGVFSLVSSAINTVKSSVGGAIRRFDTLNKYPVVMKALGYSADDVSKSMKTLDSGIDGLPTTLDEITASAQQFAPLTGSADSAAKAAVALNNAFLASGASVSDTSRGMQQYTQMLSTGKVDMMSWKTLQETMPIALNKTAAAFGFTGKSAKNNLFNALKNGKITIDQLNNKFVELNKGQDGFAELAKKNSVGIMTSFKNLGNSITKGLQKVLTKFDELSKKLTGKSIAQNLDGLKGMINGAFDGINKGIDAAMPTIQLVGVRIGNLFKAIASAAPVVIPVLQIVVGSFMGLGSVVLNTVLPAITKVFQFISQHQTLFKTIAVGVLGAVAAFKMLKIVGTIINVFASISKTIGLVIFAFNNVRKTAGLVKGAMVALQVAFNVNPIFLIISAIIALVASLVWFFTQTKTGQKIVQTAWEGIKTATTAVVNALKVAWQSVIGFLSGIWSWIKTTASNLWSGVVVIWNTVITALKTAWQSVSTFFSTLWNTITTIATTAWTAFTTMIMTILQPFISIFMSMWDGISKGLSTIWSGIKKIAQGAWELIKNVILAPILLLIDLISGNMDEFKSHLSQVWNNIKSAASKIWSGVKQVISGFVQVLISYVSGLWNGFKQFISGLWNGVKSLASSIWNGIKTLVVNLVQGLVNGVKNLWNGLKSLTASVWNGIKSLASSVWGGIKSTVAGLVNGIKQGAINAWNGLKSATSKAFHAIVGFIKDPLNGIDLFKIGSDIIQGLINGIGSMAEAVWEKIKDIAGSIKDGIKSALGISSPSRVMAQYGIYTGKGLANGIISMKKHVQNAAGVLSSAITEQEYQASSIVTADTRTIGSSFSSNINQLSDDVQNAQLADVNIQIINEWDGEQVIAYVNEGNTRTKRKINLIQGRG